MAPRIAPPFRAIHVAALVLCAVFLPWSTAFLSMSQMLLVANWLAQGLVHRDLASRFRRAFLTGPSAVFLSFFGLHVVGLLWTSDLAWGTDLVRILLPVLSLGAVLGASSRLHLTEYRAILLLGAWSVVASTLYCAIMAPPMGDYRSLSLFISHIRLVLLLCLAIAVFVWDGLRGGRWVALANAAAVLWSLYFINRLGSIQGFAILAVIVVITMWRWAARWHPGRRWAFRSILILGPLMLLVPLVREVARRSTLPSPALPMEAPRSAGGEPYSHDLGNPQQENGHHVWTHIAWNELRRTWLQRSRRSLDTLDDRGHELWSTAVRYLASKGLTKDSVGVMALSETDVRAIEQGVPNHLEGQRNTLRERFEEVWFELQVYGDKGLASGHSVAMRIEFWRAGWQIAREHWLVGVGTGDTQQAFDAHYAAEGSSLAPEWRLRAHNEYLTLWISFGVFGLVWSLFSWWWPAWKLGAWRDPLFVAWAVTFSMSCLTDDTIETQAGATFFALYHALFVLAAPRAELTTAAGASPHRV